MPYAKDRVKDTSTSTGVGDITLSGTAPTGFQTFATAFDVGSVFPYCIVDNTSGLWETGLGTLSASTTLVRQFVTDGSSGVNTLVNFTAGTKDVFCTAIAHWAMDSNEGAVSALMRGMAMP